MNGDGVRRLDLEVRTPVAMLNAGPHSAAVSGSVDEWERQGQPVVLVCLDRSRHDHEATLADVLHVPLLSAGIVSSFLLHLTRDPARVVRVMLRLLGAVAVRRATASTLLFFPAAVHLARVLPGRGIADVQGLDPAAARVALMVRELGDFRPPDLSELPVEWSRISARRIGVRWLSRRINSIAAEVTIDDGERVVVKRQRDHAGGSAAGRWAHEHRVLRTLGQAMDGELLTVPRVLFFDEPSSTLVLARAPGTALDALFAAAATADPAMMARLRDGIRGAGAWLAAMQTATRQGGDGRDLLAELVRTAVEDVAYLGATDRTIRRSRGKVVQQLDRLETRLRSRSLAVAGHHDDYWPGNIFCDGTRVTVIDFESFRPGLALEDAAFFLIRCDLLRRRFRLRIPDLSDQFFEGYEPGQRPDREALQFFTITKGLRALAKGAEDLPLPQRIWSRRTIRNAVLRALR